MDDGKAEAFTSGQAPELIRLIGEGFAKLPVVVPHDPRIDRPARDKLEAMDLMAETRRRSRS